MASIDPKFKIVGPFSPKQFSDTTTLASTIDTAVGTLTGATRTGIYCLDLCMRCHTWDSNSVKWTLRT